MISVPNVIAITFHKSLPSGNNKPAIFSCVDVKGTINEYAVKFYNKIGSRIIFEYIAALIAQELELPSPEIAVVTIDSNLTAIIPDSDVREAIGNNSGPHFGSKLITEGFSEFTPGLYLSDDMLETAVNIFAFDMLIQNYDRATGPPFGKPNLLVRGNELIMIDHEKSFACTDPLSGSAFLPWQLRELATTKNHIFYLPLRRHAEKNAIMFTDFIERFMSIPENFFLTLLDFIPHEWRNETYQNQITTHFMNIRANIGLFEKGLLEVFA